MKLDLNIGIVILVLLVSLASSGASSGKHLVIRAEVRHLQQSAFASNVEIPEDSYLVVTYSIKRIRKGEYSGNEIKVAHFGNSANGLHIGDETCIRLRSTDRIRRTAKSALEDFGVVIAEDSMADYEFVEALDPRVCE